MPSASELHDKDIRICASNVYKGKWIAVDTEAVKYKFERGESQELGQYIV
jgi:hypothetical protein